MPQERRTLSLSDIIAEIVGSLATDVRQQVVEVPWFGRTVTTEWPEGSACLGGPPGETVDLSPS